MSDVRVADLQTFLAVHRTGSITGAARQLEVTPSQVSKAVARLESHSGTKLLARSARGVSLTEAGRNMVPSVMAALAAVKRLGRQGPELSDLIELGVAGPSFLVEHLLPAIATCHERLAVSGIELPPPHLRAYLTENVFDVALSLGELEGRPSTWTSDAAGTLREALLGAPDVARSLGPLPASVDAVRDLGFIVPLSAPSDRFVPLGDACPLPRNERRVVHQAQTIGSAVELAARTDCVVYGPIIAARRLLESGELVEIPVDGWSLCDTVYIACNCDRVLEPVRRAMLEAVRSEVARVPGGSASPRATI